MNSQFDTVLTGYVLGTQIDLSPNGLLYLSSHNHLDLLNTLSGDDILSKLFITHSTSIRSIDGTDKSFERDLYDAYYAWLGQSLYLHEGKQTMDVAKGLLFNYMTTLGFPVEDFIANDTSAEDAYKAAWKYVPYEDAGFFHYELFMEERYSFCQWSSDWSIAADSIECVITRYFSLEKYISYFVLASLDSYNIHFI